MTRPTARLRVATYNVHGCVGGDGRFDPGRIAGVLDELGADVLALQEVENFRVDGIHVLDFLASRTRLLALAGPTLLRGGRHYGNALLTRLPVEHEQRIDLSVPGREPRGAIDARLGWGDRTLQAVATHLGLEPSERRRQVRRLLGALKTGGSDYALLLGDLNEWAFWGRPLRALRRYFSATPCPRTFPARWPLLSLDRIWVRPPFALSQVRAHASALARRASDHLPLVAELADGAPPVPPPRASDAAARAEPQQRSSRALL
ncbi:MAG: endonuclease/exonuclease/phosphatase family protein [Myxococcota bacterium]